MNAQSVSRQLRRAGFLPIPTSTRRTREGLRVTGSLFGVVVTADLDHPVAAERMSADAAEALSEIGLTIERVSPSQFRVAEGSPCR